jgi:hypothetical protein
MAAVTVEPTAKGPFIACPWTLAKEEFPDVFWQPTCKVVAINTTPMNVSNPSANPFPAFMQNPSSIIEFGQEDAFAEMRERHQPN